MSTTRTRIDRDAAIAWYRKNRARTAGLFALLTDDAYYAQPIALRHPIVFYEGHLPAFSLNTLVKRALGGRGIDARLESLFARGIDPDTDHATEGRAQWPSRDEVRAFAAAADAQVIDALRHAELDRPGDPLLDRAQAVFTILEHEAMHQETLLYMWHRLPYHQKRAHAPLDVPSPGPRGRARDRIDIAAGRAVLGADRGVIPFGWDNEFERLEVDVPAFSIDRHNVTNADFLAFVDAGGYERPDYWSPADWQWLQRDGITHPGFWLREDGAWFWRGLFEAIPLPPDWPVYVTHAEATAYTRWRGGRLPSEAEYQRAAYGDAEDARRFPWGNDRPEPSRGVFDFTNWEPQPVGSHPAGRSPWDVEDLVGNGWEWTSSVFAPLPGFTPMASYPEYSADFFDGEHFVMKGASPATARELLRPSFRNWFRPRYPYVYATFRSVSAAAGRHR